MMIRLPCGVLSLRNELERGLTSGEIFVNPKANLHLFVDAPWGWVALHLSSFEGGRTVIVSDNPCPEYQLYLLESHPFALLSGVSLSDIIETLKTGKEVRPCLYSPLTPIERITLRLTVRGYNNKHIAHLRSTTEGTIKNSLPIIFQKLGLHSRVQLALYYYGHWSLLEDWDPPRHTLLK